MAHQLNLSEALPFINNIIIYFNQLLNYFFYNKKNKIFNLNEIVYELFNITIIYVKILIEFINYKRFKKKIL